MRELSATRTLDLDHRQIEAKNLKPFKEYYYRFTICGTKTESPLGRFKTSPGPEDDVSEVGLAVYSCADYANGYFNAYGNPARKDSVDFVVCGIPRTTTGILGHLILSRFISENTSMRLVRAS